MTEIRTTVDLPHPAGRVWHALTDRQLLPHWFAELDVSATADARITLRPVDLPALDELIEAEILEFDPPHRMVLRWPEAGRATRVSCELAPTPEGCRLTVRQAGEDAPWEPADRERREQDHQEILGVRLLPVLDWLAFQEVDFSEPAYPVPVPEPETAAPRHRRRIAAGVAVGAVAMITVALVVGLPDEKSRPAPPAAPAPAGPTTGAPTAAPVKSPAPQALPRQPSRSPSRSTPSRGAAPRQSTTAPAPKPGQARLEARYATVSSGLLSYTGEVVVTNSGDAVAVDWAVTVTLAGGATVSDANGADYSQDGRTVTFTGAAMPADGSATIEFDVRGDATLGPKRPASCTVEDRPCAGL